MELTRRPQRPVLPENLRPLSNTCPRSTTTDASETIFLCRQYGQHFLHLSEHFGKHDSEHIVIPIIPVISSQEP